MSQLIVQMFRAGAVNVKHDLLLVRFTGKQSITTKIHAKKDDARRCDIRRDILESFVAQCTLVKSGAELSG